MVNLLFNEDVWYYWVISVGALVSFVGLIVACICSCRRNNNKSNTANRSLPDIPKDKNVECETDPELRDAIYEVTENISGDPSELYATVQDKNGNKREPRDKQSLSQQSSQDETASLYARLQTPQTSSEEHPYAQVQNVPKTESAQHNRNNSSHVVDMAIPSTSTAGNLPVAPPRSRRSSSHNSLLDQPPVDIPAASAISGGIQANQDLPYMTPPILMPLPQPPQPQNNSPQQHFSGDSQDSKGYTSISVREPLANIIAQTKSAQQQRQANRSITDPHYATVSDDSDEMYAAIDEQDKVYTSGSETYAQIQPMVAEASRPAQTEQAIVHMPGPSRADESYALAPQPPSVDSLRHVAHAHSRQASSSSATSSVANPSSPKPEKRQANSPLPPPPENPMDMYAVIDKRNKTENRGSVTSNLGKSLEDMYAKVMKKKRDSVDDELNPTASTSNASQTRDPRRKHSLIEVNRASWSSHDSVELLKRESDVAGALIVKEQLRINGETFGEEFDLDHGYESVVADKTAAPGKRMSAPSGDSTYETLRPASSMGIAAGTSRNNGDALPIYAMPFKHRQVSNASSEDPGYEKVRLRKRPASGTEDFDTDSEPNYESMPHEPNYASLGRGGIDSDADPNYESVGMGNGVVVGGDPNYESVKYMSLDTKVDTEEDPPYERVSNYKSHDDPDYERIRRGGGVGDTDDEQYVQV